MNGLKEIGKKISIRQIIATIVLGLYLATIAPLFAISVYDVPSADDYVGAIAKQQIIRTDASVWDIIASNLEHTINSWKTQQGTFSSFFLSAFLNPINSHSDQYYLCPIILLTVFHLSLLYMLWQMLRNGLGIARSYVLIIACTVSAVMLQLIPSVVEGFYWYSGATLYTGFFCIAMFTVGLLVKLMCSKKRSVLLSAAAACLGFIVGGSNYPSAVALVYVICLAMGYCLLYQKRKVLRLLFPFILCVSGLLLNVMAPGNFVRLESEGVAYHGELLMTIKLSLIFGKQFFRSWFTLPIALAMLFVEPVLILALRRSNCKFHLPFVWILLTFLGYSLLFAPSAYSYGWIGPQRYMNIVYFSLVLMLFSCEMYVTGWALQKIQQYRSANEQIQVQTEYSLERLLKKNAIYLVILIVLSLNVVTSYDYYNGNDGKSQRQIFASERAIQDMRNWQAQAYYEQYRERMRVLNDDAVVDVTFEPYRAKPKTLFFDDITDDRNDWRNLSMKSFYHKNSVVITQQEP